MKTQFFIKIFHLLFYALYVATSHAQNIVFPTMTEKNVTARSSCIYNLVPNQSLEEYQGWCVPYPTFAYNLPNWVRANYGSIDYLNYCDTSNYMGVPRNCYGYQTANDGNAYLSWMTYDVDPMNPSFSHNYREFPMVRLTEPLVAGSKYCLSFFISLADSSGYATNNIGAYFSVDSLIPQDSKVLPYTPQINVSEIISDTSKWTEVTGNYIAAGGERFIVFGNFFTDENTDTLRVGVGFSNGIKIALYYFDNVSLCLCDDTISTDNNSNYFDRITVFPNPASDFVTISGVEHTRGTTATLYDITGVQIRTQQLENSDGQFQFPLGGIASGVYVLEVFAGGETKRVKIVKSE